MIGHQFEFMKAENWTEVLRWYDELSELNQQQQQTQLTGIDLAPKLKSVLNKMLVAKVTYEWIEQPIDSLAGALLGSSINNSQNNPNEMVGRHFGVWRVVKELAQGGMGQVFVAERSDGQFAKKVALKTIKSGSYSATTKEKFLTEMQTLAQLEHPKIDT